MLSFNKKFLDQKRGDGLFKLHVSDCMDHKQIIVMSVPFAFPKLFCFIDWTFEFHVVIGSIEILAFGDYFLIKFFYIPVQSKVILPCSVVVITSPIVKHNATCFCCFNANQFFHFFNSFYGVFY